MSILKHFEGAAKCLLTATQTTVLIVSEPFFKGMRISFYTAAALKRDKAFLEAGRIYGESLKQDFSRRYGQLRYEFWQNVQRFKYGLEPSADIDYSSLQQD